MVDIGDWEVKGKGNMRLCRIRAAAPGLHARGPGEGGAEEQDRAGAGVGGLRRRGSRRNVIGAMTRQDEDEPGLAAVHARVAAAREALHQAGRGGRRGAGSVTSVDGSSKGGGGVFSRKGGVSPVGGGADRGEESGNESSHGVASAFSSSTMLDAFKSFSATAVLQWLSDTQSARSDALVARDSLASLVRQKALQKEGSFRIHRTWLHFMDEEQQVLDDVAIHGSYVVTVT